MATSPFDDEGVPRQTTALIGDGLLRGFLHNTYTARKGGGEIALHRQRLAGLVPGLSRRVSLQPGRLGRARAIWPTFSRRVGTGLYVVDVTGLHSGANPVSGEFSVGAVGHLIEGGALAAPVREVTIASDLLSLLRNVQRPWRGFALDARWRQCP